MAVRYPKREQTKLVSRVKKLIAQGHTINAACTSVSEREGGKPATNTLANWVKAAGISDSAVVSEDTTEAAPTEQSEKKTPKRRRRARSAEAENAAPATTDSTEEAPAQDVSTDAAADPAAETEAADAEAASSPAAEAATGNGGISAADAESEHVPAAELVHVRSVDTATEATADLDDLLDENHRLRTALNDANREIRAVRDLLVVYASR